MTLRVVSLCSGAGGLDLGFLAAGLQPIFAADFDGDAVRTYRENIGGHAHEVDLSRLTPDDIPDADIWIAGVPCQPWSTAGKREGANDARNLWPVVLRLLTAKRPPVAVFENVPGMLSWRNGSYVQWIDAELDQMGYKYCRGVLNAVNYGVPQKRRRLFWLCWRPEVLPRGLDFPEWTHADPRKCIQVRLFGPPLKPWVTIRQSLELGRHMNPTPLDQPSPAVMASDAKSASPADIRRAAEGRARKASSILGLLDEDDSLHIIAQRNADLDGNGLEACLSEPSVAVTSGNPPFVARVAVRPLGPDKRTKHPSQDTDEREKEQTTEEFEEGPALTLASRNGPGSFRIGGGSSARLAWRRLGIDIPWLADGPSPTIRAGVHGLPGYSPRHQGGWVEEDVAVRPHTVEQGGSMSLDSLPPTISADPGRHGADSGPRMASGVLPTEDIPAQTIDHTGELHRPGRHDIPGSWGKAATRLRRLSVRECARLQSFPDWFEFQGKNISAYRQIGNAVPPLLAWHLANAVRTAFGLPPTTVPDVVPWYHGPPIHPTQDEGPPQDNTRWASTFADGRDVHEFDEIGCGRAEQP